MKTSLTRCIIFLFLLGMTTGLSAQTIFWGDEPGQGDFDGGLNGWTSVTIQPATTGIDTAWEWVSNGYITGGLFGAGQNVAIASPTASNGAMVFNADKYSTAATGTAPEQPYPQYVEELISPTIDLSAVPVGTAMAIEFSQAFLWLQEANGYDFFSSYSVSTDDGVTWSDPSDCNPGAPNLSTVSNADLLNNTVNRRIPININAAGSSTVRVKFTFAGNFYVWALDDIKITERAVQNDVSVAPAWYASSINKMIPLSQVEPMSFMTDVENLGGNTAQNVVLNVSVTDDSGTEVYSADELYGTLSADSLDENRGFGSFTPMSLGEHTVTYEVSSDSIDENPANNTISATWEVTENVFAKEDGYTRPVRPADDSWEENESNNWAYGNHFYVPNGAGNLATSATFIVTNGNATNVAGRTVQINLYKWNAPVDNWEANPGEGDYNCLVDDRERVGFSSYVIESSDVSGSPIQAYLSDESSLEIGVTLEDNTHYVLMIEITDDGTGNVIALGASEDFDYGASVFVSQISTAPRMAGMLGIASDLSQEDYSWGGFGTDIVPVVRLNLNEEIPVSSTVNILEGANINIFPTPANENLTVDIELAKQYETADIRIMDVTGKVVKEQTFDKLQKETMTYDVKSWAAGSYFLQLVTRDGVKTEKFTVQH